MKKTAFYVDLCSVGLFSVLWVTQFSRLFKSSMALESAFPALFLACVVSYLLADFLSGVLHWLIDRYGSIRIPFLGPYVILAFRAHHLFPKDMTKLPFLSTVGSSSLILGVFLFFVSLYQPAEPTVFSVFLIATALAVSTFLAITNLVHKWSHSDHVPAVARFLQKYRIILSPEHHKTHHTAPFETHYCILTGHSNRFLQKIRFFETLEKILFSWFGLKAGDYDLNELKVTYKELMENYFSQAESSKNIS